MGSSIGSPYVHSWRWLQSLHLGSNSRWKQDGVPDSIAVVQSWRSDKQLSLVNFTKIVAVYLLRQSTSSSKVMILWVPILNTLLLIQLNNYRWMDSDHGSSDKTLGDEMTDSFLILHLRNEYHLRVAATHLFQSLQITDLHSRLAVQFFGSQSH